MVLDPGLLSAVDITSGLKDRSKIVINSRKTPDMLKSEFGYRWPVASVNATGIARETIRLTITNTAMTGALLRVAEIVKFDSLVEQLKERFGMRARANVEAMKRAYDEIVIKE